MSISSTTTETSTRWATTSASSPSTPTRAICTVYALDNKNNKAQKRKTLTSTDVQSKEFVSIAFSQ